MLFKVPLRGI